MLKLFRRAAEQGLSREQIAEAFLCGDGLEIGALHLPLKVPRAARVRYVDRMPTAELRKHYPELADKQLVEPHIIDDGETLSTVADASVDFVIANHFLEHCEDPIRTIQNLCRVIRPGGVLYCAVPDKRATFDRDRETTTLDHLLRDHEEGPEISRHHHYHEWATIVDKLAEPHATHQVEHYMAIRYSIHFHNWTPPAMQELLLCLTNRFALPAELALFVTRPAEMVFVLRKFA
ncbi:methyltransferase domain-containing protein [bacterium]|nr:methyltransferase domain-containing protein [bacterium]